MLVYQRVKPKIKNFTEYPAPQEPPGSASSLPFSRQTGRNLKHRANQLRSQSVTSSGGLWGVNFAYKNQRNSGGEGCGNL